MLLTCKYCDASFTSPNRKSKFCDRSCYKGYYGFSPESFWRRVQKGSTEECWPWTAGRDGHQYGRAYANRRQRRAHCIAWELSNGRPVNAGLCILHSCDNPPCCNPAHLREGTNLDNSKDMELRNRRRTPYIHFDVPISRRPTGDRNGMRMHPGSILRGEANGNSKLSAAQVVDIKKLRSDGSTLRSIAEIYSVGISTIHRICSGERYQ